MALEFITADDEDGYFSDTDNTDVFVKAGVVLGGQEYALQLKATEHNVTVQGAVVGEKLGISLGPDLSTVTYSTLSVAEGGLVAGWFAAILYGSSYHVTNNGDIMGESRGLSLSGLGGASTVENFGLISAKGEAVSLGGPGYSQDMKLKNTGEIAGATAYLGGNSTDKIVNQGVMDGNIELYSGNDIYKGGSGALNGTVSGGSGRDRIICGVDDNRLDGGDGSDVLKGGAGEDKYYFSSTLGASKVDTIHGFRPADDTILLDNGVFTQFAGTGKLSGARFAANESGVATQANDRIIYETDTGKLFYDSNGSEAGGRTQFAVLAEAPDITAADFLVY